MKANDVKGYFDFAMRTEPVFKHEVQIGDYALLAYRQEGSVKRLVESNVN